MLVIKCSACKTKIWKYDKIGPGEVLRCHKKRIIKTFTPPITEANKIKCQCGNEIGIDKGTYFKMIAKAFTYSGTKRTS